MSDNEKCCGHNSSRESSGHSNQKYPNETMRLLCERSSCRAFEDRPIDDKVMNQILEAGIHAPTGGNLQPYSIIKIDRPETRAKLASLCGDQPWIASASSNLLFCIDLHRLNRWAELEMAPFTAAEQFRQFWISFQDVIITAQNIVTAADAMGLGSVYIGTVLECFRDLKKICRLPEMVFPVVLLCLGYPKVRPQRARKLGIDMIVHDEKYRDPDDEELRRAFDTKYPTWKWEITEERMTRMAEVCRRVHGEKFAEKCLARIRENGCIRPAQIYFGLHYCADEMTADNEEFVRIIEEFGFNWFKKFNIRSK
nr:nitroreductase family protein [candidate division Zixibacteria bacterium]